MKNGSKGNSDIPFDFLPVIETLFRRKKIIAINVCVIVLTSFLYVFFIVKKEYLSRISFLPPTSEKLELSKEISAKILDIDRSYGIMNEQIFSVFESWPIKRKIIDQFRLYEKYKLEKNPNKIVLATKRLQKDLYLDVYESGYMSFSKILGFSILGYSSSPDTAYLLTQYAFDLLDSTLQSISSDRARRNRIFIEQQRKDNKNKLDSLQSAMRDFQEKNKTVNISEQVFYSMQTYTTLKALAEYNELSLKNLKTFYSTEVPEIKELEKKVEVYKKKLSEMETDTVPDVLPGFARYSKILPEYINLSREIEVTQYLSSFLMKEAEQVRISEIKTGSNLIVIDPPLVPEYTSRPRRVVLMAKICFMYLLIIFSGLFGYEMYCARKRK